MAGTYVLSVEAVQGSRLALATTRIHSQFAGYLCVRHSASIERRRTGLHPNFREFFDKFLSVVPREGKPYVQPFSERGSDEREHFFNRNVAGSYAQSSLRGVAPFLKVVDVAGRANDTTYSLKEKDAQLALDHLLFGQRIQAFDLATFLFRNWQIQLDQPTPENLLQVFRDNFMFGATGPGESEFSILFSDSPSTQADRNIAFHEIPAANAKTQE